MTETESRPDTRSASGEVRIEAPPEVVWEALTDATELERWFPLEARVEPGEGGKIWMSWKNEYAAESGILAWDPPRHLRTTWGFDGGGPPQVTDYRLEGVGGTTILRVVTSGFPVDPSWDAWIEGTNDGWLFELASLRLYLEEHRGEPRRTIYLRRRVAMSYEEAWARLVSPEGMGAKPLDGEPFHHRPDRQYAAVVPELGGALLRMSLEPCMPNPDARDVTLWLSAWGEVGPALDAIEGEWAATLERLYPEGETV
ncbi:MAG TPA: SRPBCC domain-containing protein [Gemmatimonadota bacterium]|nr:SRPBCC domain-containing protein [Gemmatimonadota bacterium]